MSGAITAGYARILRLLVAESDGLVDAAAEARRVEAEAKAAAEVLEALTKYVVNHTDMEEAP